VTVTQHDYDFDGHTDVLVQSPDVSVLIHPQAGGMISEFDLRRRDYAALDVLARRREAYHQALLEGTEVAADAEVTNIHGAIRVKEQGLREALVFDRYRRGGLQEWILDQKSTVDQFAAGAAHAAIEPSGTWDHAERRTADDNAVIVLERSTDDWKLEKEVEITPTGETLTVRYAATNTSPDRRAARFVSEWNIAPPQSPTGDDRIARLVTPDATADLRHETAAICNVTSFTVEGSADYALRCDLDAPADLWHFPVDTISSSEGGLERVAQGCSISITRPLDLPPNASLHLTLTWRAAPLTP
jgi:alpha-amylase